MRRHNIRRSHDQHPDHINTQFHPTTKKLEPRLPRPRSRAPMAHALRRKPPHGRHAFPHPDHRPHATNFPMVNRSALLQARPRRPRRPRTHRLVLCIRRRLISTHPRPRKIPTRPHRRHHRHTRRHPHGRLRRYNRRRPHTRQLRPRPRSPTLPDRPGHVRHRPHPSL